MRLVVAALLAFTMLCGGAHAQALHPISDDEIRAMAYAGCTESRGEPLLGQYMVQYVIYTRGTDDRPDFGGWNLKRVTHKSAVSRSGRVIYQFDGPVQGACKPRQFALALKIANDIADRKFDPSGYRDARYFKNPCSAAPGSFRGLVYIGTIGRHEFYRERHRGEPPRRGPGCSYIAYGR